MRTRLGVAFMLLLMTLWTGTVLHAAEEPGIAVAAEGQTGSAQVSRQAARSPYFLFFNQQGDLVEAVANPYLQAAGGAGPRVVEFLAAKGVHTVIASEFGAKMTRAMKEKGIVFSIATGNVKDAVQTIIHK